MDFKLFSFVILLVASVNCDGENQEPAAVDDSVIKLTDANFEEVVKTNNYFVKFFAPWCGHCNRLAPIWVELADMLNSQEGSRVKIAEVDCTTNPKTCTSQEITGYPMMKFYKKEGEVEKFISTRDLPSLTQFINDQLGSSTPEVEEPAKEEKIVVPAPLKELVILTDKNFADLTATGNWFIKFYAPWCGHCQRIAATFDELAKSFEHDTTVNIAKIDCTEYRPICKSFEAKGYPTLLWFENGKKIDKYNGPRSLDDFKAYIVQRLTGEKPAAKKEIKESGEGAAVVSLTADSFKQGIETGVTFIKFYAPWCGHCKRLAPTWQSLAEKFVGNANIKISKVDCTLQENRDLCSAQDVSGFPTLFIYKNGEKVSEYNGSRSMDDLFAFVNSHVGEKSRDEL